MSARPACLGALPSQRLPHHRHLPSSTTFTVTDAVLKKLLFQIHWLIGITLGLVLCATGVTGALLSFQDEVLEWLNPDLVRVAPRDSAPLSLAQLVGEIARDRPGERVAAVSVWADPQRSPRVMLAPRAGERRGESFLADPFTGRPLPPLRGAGFFETDEHLHRWLLLPRDVGRPITGAASWALVILAFTGLYLRWPKRAGDWRRWLVPNLQIRGRALLRNLHMVAGTWLLVVYLLSALTGIYWSYESIRTSIDTMVGLPSARPPGQAPGNSARETGRGERGAGERGSGERGSGGRVNGERGTPERGPRPQAASSSPADIDLDLLWKSFTAESGGFVSAMIRLPERAGQPIQVMYLPVGAAHERARDRLLIEPDGRIRSHEIFADRGAGARLVGGVYPLHTGSYFGLPGRLAMFVAALCLPAFTVTGWLLYLQRRRLARTARARRRQLDGTAAAPDSP